MPQPVSYLPTLAPITSSYSQPQQLPSYSQPQQLPTYSQPILSQPPSYTQPIAAPTYSQPAPTYSQPALTYVQPASLEYQQPQIYSQQPCPSFYNVQPQVPYNPPQQLPYNQQTPYIPQMAYNPPPQTPYMSPQASPQLQPPFPEDPYSKLKPNDSTATNLKPFVSPGKAECVPTAINACPLETLPKDEPKNTMLPLSTNEKAKPLTEVKASSTTEEFDYHAAALDESKSPLEEGKSIISLN
uniref:Vegetative cell wall protein gp1-like n=1 Tax=Rhabditophanes sp. KR3021 TaxID=114890 RepID=A0AC35U8B9_9BILA